MLVAPLHVLVAAAIAVAPAAALPTDRGFDGPSDAPAPASEAVREEEAARAAEAARVEAERAAAAAAAAQAAAEAEALEESEPADDYDPLVDSPEALKAKSWVRSGIVFLVVGSVLGVGGLVMSRTDPCSIDAGNGCQESARLRASLALGVPGALLVGSGAAMLAVGKVQARRIAASLHANRSSVGFAMALRF